MLPSDSFLKTGRKECVVKLNSTTCGEEAALTLVLEGGGRRESNCHEPERVAGRVVGRRQKDGALA